MRLDLLVLLRFLRAVDDLGPTSLYRIAREAGMWYNKARRYFRACTELGLVANLGREPRGNHRLVLSEEGRRLLALLSKGVAGKWGADI